jgi:hypothetical protein
MRTLLLTGAVLTLAASTAVQAADVYVPGQTYGVGPPPPTVYGAAPPPAYGAGPPAEAMPGFVEAPPPSYAQLPPPVAYPVAPHPFYPPAGYGPDQGWVYGGPPAVVYPECWWEWGYRVCAGRGW